MAGSYLRKRHPRRPAPVREALLALENAAVELADLETIASGRPTEDRSSVPTVKRARELYLRAAEAIPGLRLRPDDRRRAECLLALVGLSLALRETVGAESIAARFFN